MLATVIGYGCCNITQYKGNTTAAMIEDNDTIFVTAKLNAQVATSNARSNLSDGSNEAKPIKTPSVVAMPFPPLNRRKIVQLCPQMAINP